MDEVSGISFWYSIEEKIDKGVDEEGVYRTSALYMNEVGKSVVDVTNLVRNLQLKC